MTLWFCFTGSCRIRGSLFSDTSTLAHASWRGGPSTARPEPLGQHRLSLGHHAGAGTPAQQNASGSSVHTAQLVAAEPPFPGADLDKALLFHPEQPHPESPSPAGNMSHRHQHACSSQNMQPPPIPLTTSVFCTTLRDSMKDEGVGRGGQVFW